MISVDYRFSRKHMSFQSESGERKTSGSGPRGGARIAGGTSNICMILVRVSGKSSPPTLPLKGKLVVVLKTAMVIFLSQSCVLPQQTTTHLTKRGLGLVSNLAPMTCL